MASSSGAAAAGHVSEKPGLAWVAVNAEQFSEGQALSALLLSFQWKYVIVFADHKGSNLSALQAYISD